MSINISLDKTTELLASDLTNDNFKNSPVENSLYDNEVASTSYDQAATQSLLDEIEKLENNELEDSFGDLSLSPCVLSRTMINPESLSDSDDDFVPPPTESLSDSDDDFVPPPPESLSDSDDDFVPPPPPPKKKEQNKAREIYLVTYSQADVLKVTSRENFAKIVCAEFNRSDQVVQQWVVSAELHRQTGVHYHLAIKLRTARRFKEVRENLKLNHHIDVDFQDWQDNYYEAFTYVAKFDSHHVTSKNHPVLTNPPKTAKATAAKRNCPPPSKSTKTKKQKLYKPPRLSAEQVGEIIKTNNLRTVKDLAAFAKTQAKEGKTDLQNYLYKHPNKKQQSDLIDTVWRIEEAGEEIARKKKDRLDILREAKMKPCNVNEYGDSCGGAWLRHALETLRNNNVSQARFSHLVKNNLKHGRGKGRNLMICGPTNCAKSFMFLPLTKIFNCFMTPAKGNYNWVNAPEKEILFLNDIRYDVDGERRVMPWNMFLNLLEGVTINISMPKNFYANDYEWSEKQPIFATSDKPIVRIKDGSIDMGETQQMAERWVMINFTHQYLGEHCNYDLIPCGSCFAKLILDVP